MELYHQNTKWLDKYGNSLQGNILKFHGRDFSRMIFLHLNPQLKSETRAYLARLAEFEEITSAARQASQSDIWKVTNGPGELFFNIFLTPGGYTYFNETFPEPTSPPVHKREQSGIKQAGAYKKPVHCVLLLAHDSKPLLDNIANHYSQQFTNYLNAVIVAVEEGNKLFKPITFPGGRELSFPMDHFAFVDGISDLRFTKDQVKNLLKSYCEDRNRELSKAQIKQIILDYHVGDIRRFIVHADNRREMGSFGVFMKLHQDVPAFYKQEAKFKRQLTDSGAADYATEGAAHMIGRTREGTPLADATKNAVHTWNEFYYDDSAGAVCPFHAHTRKMNPRLNRKAGTDINILRRSMPFGPEYNPQLSGQRAKRGLLFLSFQNSLETFNRQLKQADHSEENPGVDPLIGALQSRYFSNKERIEHFRHEFPAIPGGQDKPFTFNGFGSFVKLEARVDLFAPSLDFFKSL